MAREGFDASSAEKRLEAYFGVATLSGFGTFSRAELAAARGQLSEISTLKSKGESDLAAERAGAEARLAELRSAHERLKAAKPDAIVMHPGPMNRGVEIDSAVADSPRAVILPQVTFGIAMRMAVMSVLAGGGA